MQQHSSLSGSNIRAATSTTTGTVSAETGTSNQATSVLATLRALLPERRIGLSEALHVAELQASYLLRLRDVSGPPVPVEIVTELPRIIKAYDSNLPRHAASGVSSWDAHQRAWIISVNPDEPETRQRFSVLHEFKHIIDHYHPGLGGQLPHTLYGLTPVEYIAEYFAGCVLMPKRVVKAAFFDGVQHPGELAGLFAVSRRAVEVRLDQLGLTEAAEQWSLPTPRYRWQPRRARPPYYRPLSLHRPLATATAQEATI
jgi:Zn-dependent peptidase ImmA (M78 family)